MKTKYIAGVAVALVLLVAGSTLAYTMTPGSVPAADNVTTVETDNCCLSGDCCCPGQGSCCDPALKAKAAASNVKYVKKAGAGCCATGSCCCPGQGSCCDLTAAKVESKSCCSKADKNEICSTK